MNYHSSWYSLRNVLEYYFWFRSRLHFHALRRPRALASRPVPASASTGSRPRSP